MNETRREAISQELYARRKADVGESTTHIGDYDETDDEDFIGYDSVEPGLPPASSDRQKWWLENGQSARAPISVPNAQNGRPMILNPNRPSNPFPHTDEADWVAVPHSSSRKTSFSSLSSSPYEKVNLPRLMSASASSTVPRKPAPALDGPSLPAHVGRIKLDDEQNLRNRRWVAEQPPPPPPSRRQPGPAVVTSDPAAHGSVAVTRKPLQTPVQTDSTFSQEPRASPQQQPTRSGKSAPPVAKKPAHLINSLQLSPGLLKSSDSTNGRRDDTFQPPLPARQSTGHSAPHTSHSRASSISSNKPALPPKPPSIMVGARSGDVDLPYRSDRSTVPSRRPVAPAVQEQPFGRGGSVDLLDSFEDGGHEAGSLGRWETLQPTRSG